MKRSVVFLGAAVAMAASSSAQQVDMQAVMRWSNAKVARFHVVGAYAKRTVIAYQAGSYAQGDVTDGLTLDFDWNLRENSIVGEVKMQNAASKVGALASVEAACKPPLPKGDYEHLTATAARAGAGMLLDVDGMRHYPNVDVAGCEADTSYHRVAAKDETVMEHIPVPNPMMLAVAGGGNVTVAADKQSFTVQANGWTWTYTPTPLN